MSDRLETLPEDWDRALAIVAHPDDLEYGAAAAIARWTSQGKTVTYLLATRGEAGIAGMSPAEAGPLREDEERRSAAVVGVDTVEFLDHTDGIVEYGLPLRRDIALAVRRHRPEVVITNNHRDTWGGSVLNMADHRNVGLAVQDGVRDAGNEWVFTDDTPPAWGGVRMVCHNGSPEPTHGVDVSGHFDLGVASLREHRAYLEGLGQTPDDAADWLTGGAEAAGERLGVRYGVTFEVFDF